MQLFRNSKLPLTKNKKLATKEGLTLPSRCLATIGGIHIQTHRLMVRIYDIAAEMGSVAMIYIPRLVQGGGDTQTHRQHGDRIYLL
jgi:hypothetical protein